MAHQPRPGPPQAAVAAVLGQILGHPGDPSWRDRREEALQRASAGVAAGVGTAEELVYGELDLSALVRLLEAAGLGDDEAFFDIGSGDGGPVLAAALLYPERLRSSRGVELLPTLHQRSQQHLRRLRELLPGDLAMAPVQLLHGDIYELLTPGEGTAALRAALLDTSLALCFATTWSHGSPRRVLPRLSEVLAGTMRPGGRVIVVDARLQPEEDGWRWEGDLELHLRDTAPFSTARLYTRLG